MCMTSYCILYVTSSTHVVNNTVTSSTHVVNNTVCYYAQVCAGEKGIVNVDGDLYAYNDKVGTHIYDVINVLRHHC